ncbi:hypothetical protein AAFN47_26910 [Hoeflea sp. CAU 1731]
MANRQTGDPGRIQTFTGVARIRTDVPSFAVDTGQTWRAVAAIGAGFAQKLGRLADEAAGREAELKGIGVGEAAAASTLQKRQTDAAAATRAGAKPYRAGDPVATDLPDHARAFLNAVASDESAGSYTVRYTPAGGAEFADLTRHPAIFEPTKDGRRSSAAGRYQITKTTWDRLGGGSFDAVSQDRAAWRLAQEDYRAVTGRDLSADLKSGGLTTGIVNALKGTWQAFETNQSNYVATYRSSLERFRSIETPPARQVRFDGPNPPEEKPLSTTPLALRRDGTVRGEHFDRAAINAYSWRIQQALSDELLQNWIDNGDDPQAFSGRAAEIREQYLNDASMQDPRLSEIFEKNFADRMQTYSRDVLVRQEGRLRAEEVQAANDGIDAQTRDIEKQAYLLGASPEGDAILAGQLERAGRAIDGSVAQGILTPAAAAAKKDALAESAANARIRGVFDALDSPEKQEALALGLMEEWADGKGPLKDFGYGQVKALSDTLYRDARAARNRDSAEQRLEQARVIRFFEDDIASYAATGKGLDMSELGYEADDIVNLIGREKAAEILQKRHLAEKTWDAVNGMDLQPEADIIARLETLKPQGGEEGYLEALQIWQQATTRAQGVIKQRQADPLGQADAGGAIELQPIDASSTESLQTSLQLRRDQARAVSDLYGTPLTVFRPAERAAFIRAMTDQPTVIPEFAVAVRDAFGDAAPAVLSEVSEQGPMLAHVAGIAAASGDGSVAVDVSRVLEVRKAGAYKIKMPSADRFAQAAHAVTAEALTALPKTRGAVLETAALLFEQAANTQGFDPSKVGEEGSEANSAYKSALNRALGARAINGRQFGGVTEVNGAMTIAPHDMPAEDLQRLVQSLSAEDLAMMPEIGTANGVAIKLRDIRSAHLVAVGEGEYYLALGDPESDDPRYLQTPQGGIYRFDARALYDAKGRDIGFQWRDLLP